MKPNEVITKWREVKTIYRIENPNTMNGMWYSQDGSYQPTIYELCPNSVAKDFPMEYCDDHKKDGKNWYSAGKSKENMHFWFSREDAINLVNNDFYLFEFIVKEWFEKENEILFTREGIVSMSVISIDDVWG